MIGKLVVKHASTFRGNLVRGCGTFLEREVGPISVKRETRRHKRINRSRRKTDQFYKKLLYLRLFTRTVNIA